MQPNGCVCQAQPNGFLNPIKKWIVQFGFGSALERSTRTMRVTLIQRLEIDLIPIILEQQLFDPVGMQHLVIQQMPEHDPHRIMIKRLVLGRFLPLVRR